MSYCVLNMQKNTAGALGGLQSHNQREHPSRKNHEIDPTRTHLNYDLINDENIRYHERVKERISELNLKKAVRKDAVVYCSFIVGSDREFFDLLAYKEHYRRENMKESVAIGLREPRDFEYCDQSYRDDCMRVATEEYFRSATEFFERRFGKENIVNANVHLDEPQGTPHMHLGLVPIIDGRLSAKALFTPTTLRELQTDFAAEVGAKYGLMRGREGSTAKHIDEVTFKLNARKEDLEITSDQLRETSWELRSKSRELHETTQKLTEATQSLSAADVRVKSLQVEERLLSESVGHLERKEQALMSRTSEIQKELDVATGDLLAMREAIKRTDDEGVKAFGMREWDQRIANAKERAAQSSRLKLLEAFVEHPKIKPLWEQFCAVMMRQRSSKKRDDPQIGR